MKDPKSLAEEFSTEPDAKKPKVVKSDPSSSAADPLPIDAPSKDAAEADDESQEAQWQSEPRKHGDEFLIDAKKAKELFEDGGVGQQFIMPPSPLESPELKMPPSRKVVKNGTSKAGGSGKGRMVSNEVGRTGYGWVGPSVARGGILLGS